MERSEQINNVISDLKDSLDIPHFDTEIEEKMFCSAFLPKKEYKTRQRKQRSF